MTGQRIPAVKRRRKMAPPSWMRDFVGTLSVRGKGIFCRIFQGVASGMKSSDGGQLQVIGKKSKWRVRFLSDNVLLPQPEEIPISSNFKIQGYLPNRSFHVNFVQHGIVQIHFGTIAFLQFDFEDFQRDVETLRKISTVFEFFYSKNEDYFPIAVEEDSCSLTEAPQVFTELTPGGNATKTGKYEGRYSGDYPEIKNSSQDPTENSSQNPTKNSSQNPTQNLAKKSTESFAKKSTEILAKKSTESFAKKSTEILARKSTENLSKSSAENLFKILTENLLGTKIGNLPEKQFPTVKSVSTLPEIQPRETPVRVPTTNTVINADNQLFGQNYDCSTQDDDDNMYGEWPFVAARPNRSLPTAETTAKRHEVGQRNTYTSLTYESRSVLGSKYTSKKSPKKKENIGDKGFLNISNSCYMNSTLQALMSFPALIRHLSSDKYSIIQDGLLSAFLRLHNVRFHHSNSTKTDFLRNFKEKMIEASGKFKKIGSHEDAHEYYLSFKDSLQLEIERMLPCDRSIDDLTNFEMVETLCPTCRHSRTNSINSTTQTYSELGIDVPKEMNSDTKFELNPLIQSALECPCRTSDYISKRFTRIPEILVVYLRRYLVNEKDKTRVEKNSAEINVLEKLNLKRFCTDNVLDGFEYQLQAVIEHLGSSATGGHYITRVLHEEKWLTCDDLQVTEMQEQISDSCKRTAYLLFYGHRLMAVE